MSSLSWVVRSRVTVTQAVIGDSDPPGRMRPGDMTAAVACETPEANISYAGGTIGATTPGNYEMIERRNFICFIQHCFPETSTGSCLISSSLKIGR